MDIQINAKDKTQPPHLKVASLITIIVTHYNYADLVQMALNSVLAQTHSNYECVIVDDCSKPEHRLKLQAIVKKLADPRFRLIELKKNQGQTAALFEGLKQSTGEFVALLDPDDYYEPLFLEKMLACHLNPCTNAAVAACEMGLFRIGGSMLSKTYVGYKSEAIKNGDLPRSEMSLADFGFSKYYLPEATGWLWGTTSSLMFRRDALELLRRDTYMKDMKICADTYCVYGAHIMGGTLFIDEVLSWRGLHANNAVESNVLFSSQQIRHRPDFVDLSQQIKLFAVPHKFFLQH